MRTIVRSDRAATQYVCGSMRTALALLSVGLVVLSASVADAQSGARPIELVPRISFGPIRLGAKKADVDALGILRTHPQYSAMTIPYTVYYDAAGTATRVQLTLKYAPADVKVGALVIPRTATFEQVKALFGDCKDRPPRHGGVISDCRSGDVSVSVGSGSPTEVWIETQR